ncbi:unnamed protein product [Brugia pahangi]|uniref:Uncharacterized protein n=1 Tax=Brugia pahangi TaxID=6280 RepID=A0A0N4TH70_BRUPA|nr:unnamed protein product [Brugia pahangi]
MSTTTRKEPLAIEELIAKKKELEEAETKVFIFLYHYNLL